MDTAQFIKTSVGIFIIFYGLCVFAYSKFYTLRFIDQLNGVLNGPVCIVIGVLFASNSFHQGIIIGFISLILFGIEFLIINKILKKRT